MHGPRQAQVAYPREAENVNFRGGLSRLGKAPFCYTHRPNTDILPLLVLRKPSLRAKHMEGKLRWLIRV